MKIGSKRQRSAGSEKLQGRTEAAANMDLESV